MLTNTKFNKSSSFNYHNFSLHTHMDSKSLEVLKMRMGPV